MSLVNRLLAPLKNTVRYSPLCRYLATRLIVNMDFPAVLGIDPTNRCNLKCAFCGPDRMEGPKGEMPWDLYRKIIGECSDRGGIWMLMLHNFGEPLMHPEIARMVAFARHNRAARSIQFSTNGTLLTEALARDLIEAGLDGLVFSVDAFTRDEYQKLKGADRLDKVMENARMIMNLKRRLKSPLPHVSAKMVRRRGFERTFRPFIKLWKGIVDQAILAPYSNWGGAVEYGGTEKTPGTRFACHFPWYYPIVNWDGRVFFCCAACRGDAVIGDLNRSGLGTIWKGDALKQVRSAHLEGDYSRVAACAECTYWAEARVSLDRWLARKMKRT